MNASSMTAAVQRVLDREIRPLLQFHGGDLSIERVDDRGVVHVRYFGACHGCYLQSATHLVTVRQRLLRVAGVTDVASRTVRLSDAAIRRVEEAYGSSGPAAVS